MTHSLQANQEIELHRVGTSAKVLGRVVAQVGKSEHGALYGISVVTSCEEIWDMSFPAGWRESLLESVCDGVYFVDRDRKIGYWNGGAEILAGYTAAEAVGRHCFDNFLQHVDEQGNSLCHGRCPLSLTMADGQPRQSEIYLRHQRGHRVPISVRVVPIRNNTGSIVGAMEVFSSAKSKKLLERRATELENLAYCDSLTKLSNRRYMELKLNQALQDYQQFDRQCGLLLVDLDKFKQINDLHGHAAGDHLLKTISETLSESLRPGDHVGRWGGEEFLVLMPDVTAIELGDLADRRRIQIARSSVKYGALRLSVTASIGVTLLNQTDSAESALRRTDELMYQSKHAGGDRSTVG